jgi:glycine C-acetyltransferase
MKNIDFEKASFKDFENIEGLDPYGWAKLWGEYVTDRSKNGQFNYRQENVSGCGPEIKLNLPSNPHRNFVSLVSNAYLGFTQHLNVKGTLFKDKIESHFSFL